MRYVKQDPREPEMSPRIGDRDNEGCLVLSYEVARSIREDLAGMLISRIPMHILDPDLLVLIRGYHAADAHCREAAE